MARILKNAGIKEDDVVTIIAENRQDYCTITLATLILNAVLAPINFTYTEREYSR